MRRPSIKPIIFAIPLVKHVQNSISRACVRACVCVCVCVCVESNRNFSWVHSVERIKIAERLAAQRPRHLPPLQVCVQVNVSGEASKSGCAPAAAAALAHAIGTLPQLRLRGLMAIPAVTEDVALQRQNFARLSTLFAQLNSEGLALDTLSMGMSHDLEAAIFAGATMVRVGTAIFGERV